MSDPKLSNIVNEVSTLINQFIRAYNEADREEKACCNLTISQCCTLLAFESLDAHPTMNELSSRLGLSTSTMTRHVDGLVSKGYIERTPSATDRRQVLAQLTEDGREMATRLECCEQNLLHEVLQAIPADRRETVVAALRLLLDALNMRNPNCC